MKNLKAILLIIVLFTTTSKSNFAQAFEKDKSYVSLGHGIGSFENLVFSFYKEFLRFEYGTSFGPLYAKYEYGFTDKLGIGLGISYNKISASYTLTGANRNYQNNLDYSSTSYTLRLNWHLGNHDRIDPYIGIGTGYRSGSFKETSDFQNFESAFTFTNFPVAFELTFGAKLMFTENIGAYIEVGYTRSIAQFGITGKF